MWSDMQNHVSFHLISESTSEFCLVNTGCATDRQMLVSEI